MYDKLKNLVRLNKQHYMQTIPQALRSLYTVRTYIPYLPQESKTESIRNLSKIQNYSKSWWIPS